MQKIDKKIIGYSIKKDDAPAEIVEIPLEVMNAEIKRPEVLSGSTYKIKPPAAENAIYLTINNVTLNGNTPTPTVHPFEIFINSKDVEHYQWVIALTRVISAIFRTGGNVQYLVKSLLNIHDPKGGHFKKGGVFVPSLVAEIGLAIDVHMKGLGLIVVEKDQHMEAMIHDNKKLAGMSEGDSFPENCTVCPACSTKAVIVLDKCPTCLSCGDSKCG